MASGRLLLAVFISLLIVSVLSGDDSEGTVTKVTVDGLFPHKEVKLIFDFEKGHTISQFAMLTIDDLRDTQIPLGTVLEDVDIYSFMEASDAWYKILATFSCVHIMFLSVQLMFKTISTTFGSSPILHFSDDFADLID